jgi:hypothetical protein
LGLCMLSLRIGCWENHWCVRMLLCWL